MVCCLAIDKVFCKANHKKKNTCKKAKVQKLNILAIMEMSGTDFSLNWFCLAPSCHDTEVAVQKGP